MSGQRLQKIDTAIMDCMNRDHPEAAQLMDEAINAVAPHISTPEEGFYAGFTMFALLAQRRAVMDSTIKQN